MTSPLSNPVTFGWSPKAVVGSLVAFLLAIGLPALSAVVENLTANPQLLDAVPAWLRVGVLAALVALGTLLGAYRASPGVVGERSAQGR